DDTRETKEVEKLKDTRDPIKIMAGRLTPADIEVIHDKVDAEVGDAFQQALADPSITPEVTQ
ncbi:MAG: hypothetical protein WA110_05120, partial [Anaerolineaceae bacterium]